MSDLALSLGLSSARHSKPFDVTRISSFFFGYDPDALTASDGSAVGTFADLSSNGYTATQATSALKPVLKRNRIRWHNSLLFDGSGQFLKTTAFSRSAPNTIYVAFRFSNLTGNKTILGAGDTENSGRLFQADGAFSNDIVFFSGAGIELSSTSLDDAWCVAKMVQNGASSSMSLNRVLNVAGDIGSSFGGGLTIGNTSVANSAMIGDVGLIYGFNAAIADGSANDNAIWGYLNSRFNVTQFAANGDSQTAGQGTTSGFPWPRQMIKLVPCAITQQNVAITGKTVATLLTEAAGNLDTLRVSGTNRSITGLFAGTNDIYFGADAATTFNRIVQYCSDRKTAGWKKVLACTLPPRSDAGTPVGYDTTRLAVNVLMRNLANPPWDALYDMALDPLIGITGAETNATYFQDLVHRTTAGDAIFAQGAANVLAGM